MPKNVNECPLNRYFAREVETGRSILERIRVSLKELIQICRGEKKMTNEARTLANNIHLGQVPKSWASFQNDDRLSCHEWMADLQRRVKQLNFICNCKKLAEFEIWLGGLFFPEAYLTATRQYTAQLLEVSLEDLQICCQIANPSENSFTIHSCFIEGGEWRDDCLSPSLQLRVELPKISLRWLPKKSDDHLSTVVSLEFPVYLNSQRRHMITSWRLEVPPGNVLPRDVWIQRSTAVIVWSK